MGTVIPFDPAPPLTSEEKDELAQLRMRSENNDYERFIALLEKEQRYLRSRERQPRSEAS